MTVKMVLLLIIDLKKHMHIKYDHTLAKGQDVKLFIQRETPFNCLFLKYKYHTKLFL